MDYKWTAIEAAGLTQAEFGELTGVSRVTVNKWVRGKIEPHRYHAVTIAKTLIALEFLMKQDVLPVGVGIEATARAKALRVLVDAAMEAQTHTA